MNCRLVELRNKEVINKENGCRIGFVDDLIVDTNNAKVCSIVVFGRSGALGRRDEFIIPWEKIDIIGQDTILVCGCNRNPDVSRKKHNLFKNFQV